MGGRCCVGSFTGLVRSSAVGYVVGRKLIEPLPGVSGLADEHAYGACIDPNRGVIVVAKIHIDREDAGFVGSVLLAKLVFVPFN